MMDTQDLFWTEYSLFDNKDGSFDCDEFIRKNKDIIDGNSHLWHQKFSLPCTRVHDFVLCRDTSKYPGIGAAEHSWGDVKIIKFGKIYAISRDLSWKHIIVYTFDYIESTKTEKYNLDKKLNGHCSSHT